MEAILPSLVGAGPHALRRLGQRDVLLPVGDRRLLASPLIGSIA
jgi:hypothetical protein